MSGSINLEALERALTQLRSSYDFSREAHVVGDDRLQQIARSAAIQGFEFTYELSTKVLRRYLNATNATLEEVNEMSFGNLMRKGLKRGVLSRDYEEWHEYRRLRAMTSHTYTESAASQVFTAIPAFIAEVGFMLAAMRSDPA